MRYIYTCFGPNKDLVLLEVEGMTNVDKEYITDGEHALKEIFRILESNMQTKKPKKLLQKE